MVETPGASRLQHLPAWRRLVELPDVREFRLDSCAFGSPSRKPFVILSALVPLEGLALRCPGFHRHVMLHGHLARQSAAYCQGVAAAWATAIAAWLSGGGGRVQQEAERVGHERPFVNMVAEALPWRTERRWRWKRGGHINLLEQRAIHACLRERCRRRQKGRVVILVDSRVALCSGAKGRSPSRALGSRWRRSIAYIVGGQLYPGLLFVPSRKNTSDHPSRGKPVPPSPWAPPAAWYEIDGGDFDEWDRWLKTGPSTRQVAGWAQLVLRLQGWEVARASLEHGLLAP